MGASLSTLYRLPNELAREDACTCLSLDGCSLPEANKLSLQKVVKALPLECVNEHASKQPLWAVVSGRHTAGTHDTIVYRVYSV